MSRRAQVKTGRLHPKDYFVRVCGTWGFLMSGSVVITVAVLIFGVAALYSMVGHAGASGYLASMALMGMTPEVMKPTALTLNILVACITSWKFLSAGSFRWYLFWPFALTSVPFAFLGGALSLPGHLYKQIVGCVLLYSAVRLFFTAGKQNEEKLAELRTPVALGIGMVLGFLSGLTGVGGGIFLSPLLLFARWATPLETSGVSALFILVNSLSGLAGHIASLASVPREVVYWAPAAAIGGFIGAHTGSRKLPGPVIKRVLAAVLVIAGVKMFVV